MGREDEDSLRERGSRDRTGAVVRIGFTARPAGNRVLEVVENVNINLVKGSVFLNQLSEIVFEIVLFRQFQNVIVLFTPFRKTPPDAGRIPPRTRFPARRGRTSSAQAPARAEKARRKRRKPKRTLPGIPYSVAPP